MMCQDWGFIYRGPQFRCLATVPSLPCLAVPYFPLGREQTTETSNGRKVNLGSPEFTGSQNKPKRLRIAGICYKIELDVTQYVSCPFYFIFFLCTNLTPTALQAMLLPAVALPPGPAGAR